MYSLILNKCFYNRLDWVKDNQDYIHGKGGEVPSDAALQNEFDENGGEHDENNTGLEIDDYDNANDVNYSLGEEEVNFNGEALHENVEGGEEFKNDENDDREGRKVVESKKSFLGSKFHGSRRHLKSLSTNGLIVVSERGEPHLFITLTTNTEWPELKEQLFYGQTAFDRYSYKINKFKQLFTINIMYVFNRPDITTQVLKARLTAFLHNLRAGKYFRTSGEATSKHEVEYEMKSIEYQHRGLPHVHIVIRLSNMPAKENIDGQLDWIKKHVHSCAPRIEDCAYFTPEKRDLVRQHMLHVCSSSSTNGCLKDGKCKRGYDSLVVNEGEPSFGDMKFPVYGRLEEEDLAVVPHNIGILEDWQGHSNVEWCGSAYTPVYLYKYIYKGAKKEKFRLTNAEDIEDDDEINLYLRARMLSSMDAIWRVMVIKNIIIIYIRTRRKLIFYES